MDVCICSEENLKDGFKKEKPKNYDSRNCRAVSLKGEEKAKNRFARSDEEAKRC